MLIETHDKLGKPQRFTCTRLVIRDVNNTPVMLAMQQSPIHIFTVHAGEAGFERALRAMGIHDTVVIDRVDNDDLQPPPGTLWTPQSAEASAR